MQQASAYRYQAKIADRNAALVSEQTQMSQDNTRLEAQRLGRKVGQTAGQQTAAMAANGIDLGFGNALDVAGDTAMLANEDANQLYRQGFQDVRGYDIQQSNLQADAKASRNAAKGALIKGAFDVAGTVLGGAGQMGKLKAGTK